MKTIYRIRNKINGKSYIGIASDLNQRIAWHLTHGYKKERETGIGPDLAILTIANFEVSALESVVDELADMREAFWIKELNTLNPNGYNMQGGGKFFRGVCKETSEKLSKVTLGLKRTDEAKNNMVIAQRKSLTSGNNRKIKINHNHLFDIKTLLENGATQQSVADKYGVTRTAISHIKNNTRWNWVDIQFAGATE